LSRGRFASLKINTKIVKYTSRKGGIRKQRREDVALRTPSFNPSHQGRENSSSSLPLEGGD